MSDQNREVGLNGATEPVTDSGEVNEVVQDSAGEQSSRETSFTRRAFIQAVPVIFAATLPQATFAQDTNHTDGGVPTALNTPIKFDTKTDVVIVGGGFAGLAAALELTRAGVSIILLEARDRVGGRAKNVTVDHRVIGDIGAQAASGHHKLALDLAHEMGVETFPLRFDGKAVVIIGDDRMEMEIPDPQNPGPRWEPTVAVLRQLDAMSQEIDPTRPWEARLADEWDAQTTGKAQSTQESGLRRRWPRGSDPDQQAAESLTRPRGHRSQVLQSRLAISQNKRQNKRGQRDRENFLRSIFP